MLPMRVHACVSDRAGLLRQVLNLGSCVSLTSLPEVVDNLISLQVRHAGTEQALLLVASRFLRCSMQLYV